MGARWESFPVRPRLAQSTNRLRTCPATMSPSPDIDAASGAAIVRGVRHTAAGEDAHGRPVQCFTLTNATGSQLSFLSLGGIIRELWVPDRHGRLGDVVLGFAHTSAYQEGALYLGALIGRYANRIGGGHFTLDGQTHHLACNEGPNCLHGGALGFDAAHWHVEPFERHDGVGAVLTHESPDGDQGFPGALSVRVTYTWRDDNALVVDYVAETSAPTPVNLTQHMFFNLSGEPETTVLDHELMIHASRYTPVNAQLLPTGELPAVDGTPFDFRFPRRIGERIRERHPQLQLGAGYDHNWVLDHASGARVEAARLVHPGSGRLLVVSTTEPGVQMYSGNHLGVGRQGKVGALVKHGGVALETQHFPDSPNWPAFPDTTVRPGTPYRSSTVFAFRIQQ